MDTFMTSPVATTLNHPPTPIEMWGSRAMWQVGAHK